MTDSVPNPNLNWLRAAVLGANDGIVSVASIVVGVAGATSDIKIILTAGVAGLVAGALSMAVGEYVSVSSQRDAEQVILERGRPGHRLTFENLVNPYEAALASAISFLAGAIIPLIAVVLPPANLRVPVVFAAVLAALVLTGSLSANAGGANVYRAIRRVVIGGALAMAITYAIGLVFHVRGI